MTDAGYDYAAAILELRNSVNPRRIDGRRFTYDDIAAFCGFESERSIGWILSGKEPKHRAGERLYILYVETFGKKPPMPMNKQFFAPTAMLSTA